MSYGYSKPKTNGLSKLPWGDTNDPREDYDFPKMFIEDEGGDDETFENDEIYQDNFEEDNGNSKYDQAISSYINNLPETQEHEAPRHVEKRRRNRNSKRSSSSGSSNQYKQPSNALDLLMTKVQLKNANVRIKSYEEKEIGFERNDEPVKFYQVRSRKQGKSQKRRQETSPDSDELLEERDFGKRTKSNRGYSHSTEERNHPGSRTTRDRNPKMRSQAQRKKASNSSKSRSKRSGRKTGVDSKTSSTKSKSSYKASRYKQSSRGGGGKQRGTSGGYDEYVDDLAYENQYETDENLLEDDPYTSNSGRKNSTSSTSSRGAKKISNLSSRKRRGRKTGTQKKQVSSRRKGGAKRKGRTTARNFEDDDMGDNWSGDVPSVNNEIQEAHAVGNFDEVPIGGSGAYKMPGDDDMGRYGGYNSHQQPRRKAARKNSQPRSKYRPSHAEDDDIDDDEDSYGDVDEEEDEGMVNIMKKKKSSRKNGYGKRKRSRTGRAPPSKPKRNTNFDDMPIGGNNDSNFDDMPIGGKNKVNFDDFGPNSMPPGTENSTVKTGMGNGMDGIPEFEQVVLVECEICNRKFREDLIERHKKNIHFKKKKKRKVFSMTEKRVGKEGKQLYNNLIRNEKRGLVKKKKNKWRERHQQFQSILKNTSTDEPQYDSRIPCPHCGRKFSELAAERHIPKCEKIVNKPTGIKIRRFKYDPFRDKLKKERERKQQKAMRKTYSGRRGNRGKKKSTTSRTSRYGSSGGTSGGSSSSSSSSRYSGYRRTLRGGRTVGKKIRRRY